jgi:hypothetical protein
MKYIKLWGFNVLSYKFSQILVPYISVAKDSSLVTFGFLSSGEQAQTFRRILTPSKRQ